jgi:ABC-type transport system involved in multi-copper enzyme maturation permease subunit
MRSVYAAGLLLLICTAWMVLAGTQIIRNIGDMARFGAILFQILAPLQLALLMFLAAIQAASSIAIEKDRQTLILLLMSRLSNSELVLGKLFSSLLGVGVMLITSLPIFMLIVLFGGTSFEQVGWTFAVTGATILAAGSLGATVALWREKTFQTLALVVLAIVFWIGLFESIGFVGGTLGGYSAELIAAATSPIRAIMAASHPSVSTTWPTLVVPYLIVALTVSGLLCGLAILRVRRWNPSRDVKPGQEESIKNEFDMITGKLTDAEPDATGLSAGERLRSGHVDDRSRQVSQNSRRVWDNPVLWREMCTWAYGRKILFIRGAYWLLAACVFFALYSLVTSGAATRTTADASVQIPVVARPLAPFMLVSIVLVNALAVTSITTERDGRAIDLLRVTDISPKEFLFGKLGGVLYISLDLMLLPILMCIYVWYSGALTGENLLYLILGLLVLYVFVAVLGIHSGMSFEGSRQAIGVSLGTVFFLFLGVVTSMMMMVSFTGNVEAQLTPFLACIVGGAIGLYVALGRNTPSPALAFASGILPFAMFYSITSLLLKNYLSVLLVVAFTYGFATTAMIMPRLSEFLISTGRVKSTDND